jgi:hypothetical protein
MKNHSEEYGKTRETLPLEGGGKRVGVKGLTSIAKDVGNTLRKQSGLYGASERSSDGGFQVPSPTTFTPHPDPLPQGERGDNF